MADSPPPGDIQEPLVRDESGIPAESAGQRSEARLETQSAQAPASAESHQQSTAFPEGLSDESRGRRTSPSPPPNRWAEGRRKGQACTSPQRAAVLFACEFMDEHNISYHKNDVFKKAGVTKTTGWTILKNKFVRRLHNDPNRIETRGRKRKNPNASRPDIKTKKTPNKRAQEAKNVPSPSRSKIARSVGATATSREGSGVGPSSISPMPEFRSMPAIGESQSSSYVEGRVVGQVANYLSPYSYSFMDGS